MEHTARRRLKFGALLLALFTVASAAMAQRAVSFSLSSNKTFSPDEKPTIHLYTHDVSQLEFRIYKVQDPVKFLSNLKDLHSFDNGTSEWGPREQIDEETWLERFHDWKHHLWYLIRSFFRDQFTADSRDALREKQANLTERSRIIGATEFAQVPLLNDKQLVARWRQQVPPNFVSDAQDLPIDPLPPGIYMVEATDSHYKAYTLIFVSRLVLVTRTVSGHILSFCVDRKTGAPVADANVTFGQDKQTLQTGKTGADGVVELTATLTKAKQEDFESNLWIVATTPDDVAVVTPASYAFTQASGNRWKSYVYTDRPVYRPGHTVYWKAILREQVADHLQLPKMDSVQVKISDQTDHAIFTGKVPVSKEGTVTGQIVLDAHASLGYYSVHFGDTDAAIGDGTFRVEEYRKPEYQVRISPAMPRVIEGETMQVTVDSRYFFGEPVAFGKVKYRIYSLPHSWWEDEEAPEGGGGSGGDAGEDSGESSESGDSGDAMYGADQSIEGTGTLDAHGRLTIPVPTAYDAKDGVDLDYMMEAGVTDAANREITGRGRFLATVGNYRIQAEPESYAVQLGQPARLKVSAVDYDNKPVQTTVHLQLVYRRWENGKSRETKGPSTDVATDAQGNATAMLTADSAGSADISATAAASENRTLKTSAWLWILGSGQEDWAQNGRDLQVLADKKKYAPGDTAHLSIISQKEGFHALVIASGYSTEFQQVVSSTGGTVTFDLPITTDSQPNVRIRVMFVRDGELFEGAKVLKVPPEQERLQVVIAPANQVFQPQQAAHYDVYTRDSRNQPVVSDFSFGVVDEALYSLYPDSSGDIVSALYPSRYEWDEIQSSLEYRFYGHAGTKSPMLAWNRAYHPQLAQVKPGNDVVQPKVRKAFPDTAYWVPDAHTDAQGHANVSFSFPDSLTTWRTTVRAITADSKGGAAINRVIVRKNIIVRMGTPRFLRKGDEVVIPVIVHNYLDHPKQIGLSLDAKGLDVVSGGSRQITVGSRADGSVDWRLKASQIGTATLLAKALSTEESDALELSFPVEPNGVAQQRLQQGVIREATATSQANATFPQNTDAAAHALHIEVTPSVAGSILPALQYLSIYPYGCTEQTMSSFLPNVLLTETAKKLHLPTSFAPADLDEKIKAGLERLADYQHEDGGWGWWKEDPSLVFMTAYVVSGLAQANDLDLLHGAQTEMLQRGQKYLAGQLSEHPRMLPDLRAYVIYALATAHAGEVKGSLDTLWSRRNDLSAEGLAMTGLAMLTTSDARATEVATLLTSKAKHEGELAYWPSGYSPLLDISYSNNVESTAFALRFLSKATPPGGAITAQSAQWLVLHREDGYWWESTEQTAFALFGLTEYLAVSKELDANFDVDVHVNGKSVGKRHFGPPDALSGAVLKVDVPASSLQPQDNAVEVVKHGEGNAYWLAQENYYSTEKRLYQKESLQLNVARDYSRIVPENKDGKISYRLEPIQGALHPGDVVAVHLGVSGSPVKYLMLEDPIPAGAEFITRDDSYQIAGRPDTWSYWYTRRELHDDRAVMFSTGFAGRQETFYLLKVVNPGAFAVSPARVSLMYQPEVDATSDQLSVRVEKQP